MFRNAKLVNFSYILAGRNSINANFSLVCFFFLVITYFVQNKCASLTHSLTHSNQLYKNIRVFMYYIEHISYSITTIAGKAWYDISQSNISTLHLKKKNKICTFGFLIIEENNKKNGLVVICEILRIVKCLSEADLE